MSVSPSILFRAIPSMTAVLDMLHTEAASLMATYPRPLVRESVDRFLNLLRDAIREGVVTREDQLHLSAIQHDLLIFLARQSRPHFRRVLNASGVVIHTNMGRSLLAEEAVQAVTDACAHYSNLEFDLQTGERGSRYSHVEQLLCRLTGAESALVVNNNAAAVFLVLDTLCKGREAVVSRGELVEIGGSFRIPEIMAKSGCFLREVGATNRTHVYDYERAITEQTAMLMKVHTSNFRIIGFTSVPDRHDLVALARRHHLPVFEDLGSGSLCDFSSLGLSQLAGEPAVQTVVASGIDVVSFSGDKVLGGPQAGIIVGRKEYIEQIKKNSLNRALRIDKMTLAALEATLRLYTDIDLAKKRIPTLSMVCMSKNDLQSRARKLARIVNRYVSKSVQPVGVDVIPGVSRVGGGAFPECDLATTLVRIHVPSPDALREKLLDTDPPLVGRVENNAFCLDPRTLRDNEFTLAANALYDALLCLNGNKE